MITNELRRTIERVHGDAGREWLMMLPDLLNEAGERWSLDLDRPFDNLSYNLVIPGHTVDGAAIVLKLGVPCSELITEADALDLFEGNGAVRLFAHDTTRGMLLMERVSPGIPIHKLQDDAEASQTAARLMRQLWRVPPTQHSFPNLLTWFRSFTRLRERFAGGSGPFPAQPLVQAETTLAELLSSTTSEMIIHGDLHHDNILFSAERGWLAIDPKGVLSDAGYEVGPFMLNQLPVGESDSEIMETMSRRLVVFSNELQIEHNRLAQWAFCHAVLSAVWSFEESDDWESTIRLAGLLEKLR